LGESLTPSGLGTPFEREQVAAELSGIAVAFHRPRLDYLAAALRDRRQRNERALGPTTGLFLELAPRGNQRCLAGRELPLGNRPGPFVLLCPKRSSRMHQEDLKRTAAPAKHQETCARLGHLLAPRSYFCHTAYPSLRSSRANTHSMRCASA